MLKRVAIYDPYLDTLGGGERYCLTVAEVLLKNGYRVDLFWSGNQDLITKAEERFSLNLKGLNLVNDVFHIKTKEIDLYEERQNLFSIINRSLNKQTIRRKFLNFTKKIKTTRKYDILFYVGDGSIPALFAKKNILHIQVPFSNQNSFLNQLKNKAKVALISKIACNSQFTSNFYRDNFGSKISVLYPPVDVQKFDSSDKKENIILSVGRFDNILNAKKQDVLIDAFKELVKKHDLKDWKLVLAGGSLLDADKNAYLTYLKEKAVDFPIEFVVNPNFSKLKEIYSVSKIYWHAAGFEVDELQHPENTEHFGMTVVEAMASGLVPVVVAKGGIPEIINNGIDGYLWNHINELVTYTQKLIDSPKELETMSQQALFNCKKFSKENFAAELLKLISN